MSPDVTEGLSLRRGVAAISEGLSLSRGTVPATGDSPRDRGLSPVWSSVARDLSIGYFKAEGPIRAGWWQVLPRGLSPETGTVPASGPRHQAQHQALRLRNDVIPATRAVGQEPARKEDVAVISQQEDVVLSR
jgi:hypothetical protein